MFSACGQLAGGNCTTGRISGVLTEQHVKETLNGDKLMHFNEVNLSDLKLTFPLPPHLASKRAHSPSLQWELIQTEILRTVGLFAPSGFIKLSLNQTGVSRLSRTVFVLGNFDGNAPKLVIILSK